MECFNCGELMERDEEISLEFPCVVGCPRIFKSGYKCPKCKSIKFDNNDINVYNGEVEWLDEKK